MEREPVPVPAHGPYMCLERGREAREGRKGREGKIEKEGNAGRGCLPLAMRALTLWIGDLTHGLT